MKKKELILSEDQARRLWERAANLQAEEAQKAKAAEERTGDGGGKRKLLSGVEDERSGYSLSHIKQAGLEVGIEPDFLELALAEEAILEIEGGGESGFWDRTAKRFLGDANNAFDVRREIPFPPRAVWLAFEETLTSEGPGLELLEVRGGPVAEGGIAIFESPYSYQRTGTLEYWATVAEVRRFMVQVTPDGDDGCVVSVRAPLRRSRRVNGAVGMACSGVGGAVGGGLGMGITGVVAGAVGLAALPVGLGLMAVGVLAGEGLTRMGYIRLYRYGLRALEKAFRRILSRVERDVRREMERSLPS